MAGSTSRRSSLLALAALTAASTPALALAPASAAPPTTAGRTFTVELTGAAEAPGPGDPDGAGTATITVNPGLRRVCYTLDVMGIEPAGAAHIHIGPAGEPGPVVVPLTPPTSGASSDCVDVERALARDLVRDPAAYYVNVHNAPFPSGALRGQLR